MNDLEIKKVAQAFGISEQEARITLAGLGKTEAYLQASFNQVMEQAQEVRTALEQAQKVWTALEAMNPQAELARLKAEVKTERHPLRKKQLQREIQRLQFELKRGGKV